MGKKPKKHYRLQKKHFFAVTAEIIFLFLVFQLIGNFTFVELRNPSAFLKEKMGDENLIELAEKMQGS